MLFGKPKDPGGNDFTITIEVKGEEIKSSMGGWIDPKEGLHALLDAYLKMSDVLVKEHERICPETNCHLVKTFTAIREGIKKVLESHKRLHKQEEK